MKILKGHALNEAGHILPGHGRSGIAFGVELFNEANAIANASGTNKSYDGGTGYFTLIRNASGNGIIPLTTVSLQSGTEYRISFTRADLGGEALHSSDIRIAVSTVIIAETFTGEQSVSLDFIAGATNTVNALGGPSNGYSWAFKNMSIREIL